jgi:2-amino-4-hydroxy-6-hydroxymethyldihydropteridine diphosphokinase
MTQAVLALGANVGDPLAALRGAVAALTRHPAIDVAAVSGLWRTSAVGGPAGQPDYLNAVVLVDTTLGPDELLGVAQGLERAAGRARQERWGPRTLDVDVLAVAGRAQRDEHLTLPHPRAHERRFVLAPWREVTPDWVLDPANGQRPRTVGEWADSVDDQQAVLVESGGWWR